LAKEVDKETREFIVDVSLEKLPLNWAVGQRAEVYIEAARKVDVVAVPEDFIKWRDNSPGLFVLKNGRAQWRTVTQGVHGGSGMIEILDGLREGDTILKSSSPAHLLSNNSRVTVR
jgi:HlyD family secretion protein